MLVFLVENTYSLCMTIRVDQRDKEFLLNARDDARKAVQKSAAKPDDPDALKAAEDALAKLPPKEALNVVKEASELHPNPYSE